MLDEGRERERLGHDVGNHTRSRDVRDRDVTLLHLLADEVLRQAKVANAVVELRVARESVGALVVAEELDWFARSLRQRRAAIGESPPSRRATDRGTLPPSKRR